MKTIGIVIFSLLLGVAVASLVDIESMTKNADSEPLLPAETPAEGLATKLLALEAKLDREISQRQQLQASLERLLENSESPSLAREALGPMIDDEEAGEEAEERTDFADRGRNDESREQRLQQAGFPAGQAAWIVQREKEIRLDTLYERWEQRREALLNNPAGGDPVSQNPMRAELGEQAYERYLEASGRPTSVRVANLIDNSPAASAGLQPGDEIVSYNGQRVYDLGDLNEASVQGELGESVLVEVVRNGSRIQLATERGPLGIISRRRWR